MFACLLNRKLAVAAKRDAPILALDALFDDEGLGTAGGCTQGEAFERGVTQETLTGRRAVEAINSELRDLGRLIARVCRHCASNSCVQLKPRAN